MKIDRKRGARILTMLEMTIGFSYLYLALEHPPYIVIGLAHLVSALLHSATHEL